MATLGRLRLFDEITQLVFGGGTGLSGDGLTVLEGDERGDTIDRKFASDLGVTVDVDGDDFRTVCDFDVQSFDHRFHHLAWRTP